MLTSPVFHAVTNHEASYNETVDAWPELVELYEYKVADILAGRDPRGGRRSLGALRDRLLTGDLDSPLLRRFRHADKLWREFTVASAAPTFTMQDGPERQHTWNLPSAVPADEEATTLAVLGTHLWRLRLDDALAALAARWRREPGNVTMRALYALSLNLEAGTLGHDVPDEDDPLVSLTNPEVSVAVLSGLVDAMLTRQSETQTAVAACRPMMLELAANPYPRDRRALLDVGSPGIDDPTRTGTFQRSAQRTALREALGRGFETIVRLLPAEYGGSGDESPHITSALFARLPSRRLAQPDEGTTLAVRLTAAGEIRWHDRTVAWRPEGTGWTLMAGGTATPLRREPGGAVGVTRVSLDGVELRALLRQDYLLLDLELVERVSLPELVALGRVVTALLEPADAFLHLRVARGVAQWLRDGRLDLASLAPGTAAKYAAASPDTLFAFARKGASNLLARLTRRPDEDVTRAFREVARTLGCDDARTGRLMNVLRAARHARQQGDQDLPGTAEIRNDGDLRVVTYDGDPVAVPVLGRVLTLRADYRNEITAVLPGAPAVPVRDLWVFTFPQGGVIIARSGQRFAVGFAGALTASST